MASSPAARSAVTRSRFTGPASTISTTSATCGVVTRNPSRFSTGSERRRESPETARPPPCTTTVGPPAASAFAHADTHSGRSSSLPPILTTRTFSTIPTLKSGLGGTLPLRAALLRAHALAWEYQAPPIPRSVNSAREPRRFLEAQHHIHVLHRLPRRAFDQVVDRRDDGEPGTPDVLHRGDTDRQPIPVDDVLEGRRGALGHHHAWLPVVRGFIEPLGGRLIDDPRERHVNRLEDPALHGEQVRREDQIAVEPPFPGE